MFYPGIEKKAENILKNANIQEPPISVDKICEQEGLKLEYSDLGQNVSGLLAIQSSKRAIGVNVQENKVRQRFTIAHELGHFVLHSRKQDQLFIEGKKMYRNEESSLGELKKEREANAFAAAILMPKALLEKEITKHQFDISHEESIKELAKSFKVSEMAMTYRLTNLKFI